MHAYCAILFLTVLGIDCLVGFLIPDGLQMVKTKVGEIHGHLTNVQFDGKIYQARKFLGIPYAKAPVGNLRLRKPEPLVNLPYSPFNAIEFGLTCPQPYAKLLGVTTSEDCLFLNVYAPSSTGLDDEAVPSSTKAVMIWIHGGGFFGGFSNTFDGSVLSSYNDVIVVTMNYRLGPLGFLSTHDHNSPGNYGLWDQHLAIKWVYDNIAAFGGDPNNILIFGESAGSSSIVYQTLFPGNKGLVKRAIAESGTIAAWGLDRMGTNRKISHDFANYIGCESMGVIDMTCIRSKSVEEMTNATEIFQEVAYYSILWGWVPVLDNEFVMANTDTVLNNMAVVDRATPYVEAFHSIDFMIGACNLDGLVYLSIWIAAMNKSAPFYHQDGFTSRQFENVVVPQIAENVLNEKPTSLALEAIKYEYTNWDDPNNATKRLQSLVDITTDFALNAPTILTANAHRLGSKATYVYQFATAPPGTSYVQMPPILRSETSASHADDLPFVFGFLFSTVVFNYSITDINAEHFRVSRAVMTMWANFAKTGNPNTPTDLQQIYSGLVWPQYDMADAKYLEITPGMSAQSVKPRLQARAVQFWNELLPEVQELAKLSGHK